MDVLQLIASVFGHEEKKQPDQCSDSADTIGPALKQRSERSQAEDGQPQVRDHSRFAKVHTCQAYSEGGKKMPGLDQKQKQFRVAGSVEEVHQGYAQKRKAHALVWTVPRGEMKKTL